MELWKEELYHHGILGMRWGKKNGPPYPLSNSDKSSLEKSLDYKTKKQKKRKSKDSIKDLSDSELKEKIARLELEKKYKDLLSGEGKKKIHKGRKFVKDVLETAGKDIATQWAKYMIGTMVNKMSKSGNIVNPKKGQKDK